MKRIRFEKGGFIPDPRTTKLCEGLAPMDTRGFSMEPPKHIFYKYPCAVEHVKDSPILPTSPALP